MTDSLFKQFVHRVEPSAETKDFDAEGADDFGFFSVLRGVRDRALMLELRKKDGSVAALGYGWLDRVDYDPSAGITLRFGGTKVTISGRNLGAEVRPNVRLLDGILRHRVPWIREASEPEILQAAAAVLVIEELQVE
jgi:hypothetical protein